MSISNKFCPWENFQFSDFSSLCRVPLKKVLYVWPRVTTTTTCSRTPSCECFQRLGSGLSIFYRDILRQQYIALFGNIRKFRDTRGYHDTFIIFFIYDISHFWPFMDQSTIAIHYFSCEFNWFFFAVVSHLPFICDELTPYLTL